jgi:hypothetical protein
VLQRSKTSAAVQRCLLRYAALLRNVFYGTTLQLSSTNKQTK